MGLRSNEATQAYQKERGEVFDAMVKAMDSLKIKVEEQDAATGRIEAVRGLNFLSAGSRLSVTMKEGEGEVAVTIHGEARSKLTLLDYGQSSRDIKNVFNKTEEILGVSGEARTTSQAEEEKADEAAGNACPSCGKPVAEAAKFCTSCGAKLGATEK